MFKYLTNRCKELEKQQECFNTISIEETSFPTASSSSIIIDTTTSRRDCPLLDLPTELLHRIFIYAQNPVLVITCSRFWSLGQLAILRADYLMHRYGPTGVLGETSMRRHIVSLPTIYQLLKLGCDPTADDSWLFIKGCELGQVDLCRKILQMDHCNVAHMLNLAAMQGSIGVVDLLATEFGANVHHDTVLVLACRENQVELVKYLVETFKISVHAHSERQLRNACLRGSVELVAFLLQGADVHAYNDTAIQNAVYKGLSSIVVLLLEAGAHADVNDNVCIKHAIKKNDLRMVKCLVEKGGVDPRCNHDWPLKEVCRRGLDDILLYLIPIVHTGIDIGDGVLLELALVHDQLDTLKVLLSNGANLNCDGVVRGLTYIVNPQKKYKHKDKMIQYLLDAGLRLNRQTDGVFVMPENKITSYI
ncbi:ankyrin repeat-containing domain protein [Parasitella parasitica]|nr:ankyrin repeat-containing domain protein [Parasitella parasitica]